MGNFAPPKQQLRVLRILERHGGSTYGISMSRIAEEMGWRSYGTVGNVIARLADGGWVELVPDTSGGFNKYALTIKARAYLENEGRESEADMAGKKSQLVWRLCALCSAITQEIGDRSPVSAGSTAASEYAEATRKEIRRRIGCELGIDEASLKAMAAPFYCKGETLDFGDPQVGDKFWEIYAKLGGRRAGRL